VGTVLRDARDAVKDVGEPDLRVDIIIIELGGDDE
jgi:hypothetical protein